MLLVLEYQSKSVLKSIIIPQANDEQHDALNELVNHWININYHQKKILVDNKKFLLFRESNQTVKYKLELVESIDDLSEIPNDFVSEFNNFVVSNNFEEELSDNVSFPLDPIFEMITDEYGEDIFETDESIEIDIPVNLLNDKLDLTGLLKEIDEIA